MSNYYRPKYPYGHGHLIAKGTSSEKASIMAYGNWINYYSDPSLIYPGTGTPTGVKDVSNCVKVITDNRYMPKCPSHAQSC